MPPDHCPTAGMEFCPGHSPQENDEDILDEGIQALRHLLVHLMKSTDIEMLAKHIPRASSVAIQAARIRHQIGEGKHDELMTLLGSISEELDEKIIQ